MKSEIIVKEMKLRTIRGIFGVVFMMIVVAIARLDSPHFSSIEALTTALVAAGLLTAQYFSHKRIVMENMK